MRNVCAGACGQQEVGTCICSGHTAAWEGMSARVGGTHRGGRAGSICTCAVPDSCTAVSALLMQVARAPDCASATCAQRRRAQICHMHWRRRRALRCAHWSTDPWGRLWHMHLSRRWRLWRRLRALEAVHLASDGCPPRRFVCRKLGPGVLINAELLHSSQFFGGTGS